MCWVSLRLFLFATVLYFVTALPGESRASKSLVDKVHRLANENDDSLVDTTSSSALKLRENKKNIISPMSLHTSSMNSGNKGGNRKSLASGQKTWVRLGGSAQEDHEDEGIVSTNSVVNPPLTLVQAIIAPPPPPLISLDDNEDLRLTLDRYQLDFNHTSTIEQYLQNPPEYVDSASKDLDDSLQQNNEDDDVSRSPDVTGVYIEEDQDHQTSTYEETDDNNGNDGSTKKMNRKGSQSLLLRELHFKLAKDVK